MDDARHVVLKAKQTLEVMDVQDKLDRDQFVTICTTAARRFLQDRRGKYRIPLSPADLDVLHRIISKEVQAVTEVRSSSTASGTRSTSIPHHSAADTPTSLPPKQVAVVKEAKRLLESRYHAGAVTREQFSDIVMAAARDFTTRFDADLGSTLSKEEENWVELYVTSRVTNLSQGPSVSFANSPPPREAGGSPPLHHPSPTPSNPNPNSYSGNGQSPSTVAASNATVEFEKQMAQAKQLAVSMADTTQSPVGSGRMQQRAKLYAEIAEIQQQISLQQSILGQKLQELARLDGL
jgi:hypothetical protein